MKTSIFSFSCKALLAAGFFAASTSASAFTPADVPLQVGGTVEPNVMFILDDSGSMRFGFMPDDIGFISGQRSDAARPIGCSNLNGYAGIGDTTVCPESTYMYYMSSATNTVYYNPAEKYLPPPKGNGSYYRQADYFSAYVNGYAESGSVVNLSNNYRAIIDDFYACWSHNRRGNCDNTRMGFVVGDAGVGRYYVRSAGCSNILSSSCYKRYNVGDDPRYGTLDEQRKNFANWFSYYRTRLLAAKAGSKFAFDPQKPNIRVGYGSINKGSSSVDGSSTSTIVRGVRNFEGTSRSEFFVWLKDLQASGGTPLRRALDDAGQYYSRAQDTGPWSSTPGVTGGTDYSCRQSYTILTTDGYWNDAAASTAAARADVDGYAPGNTLADVAAYYWANDLRPGATPQGLVNNVPTSRRNSANWQHMVTVGVSLGLYAGITPTKEKAFDAVEKSTNNNKFGEINKLNWGDPITNTTTDRLRDLLHASANGRGDFFNAQTPQEFAKALSDSLLSIANQDKFGTPRGISSARVMTDTLVYEAGYNSGSWSGTLKALSIEMTDQGIDLTDQWEAGSKIPRSGRNLLTNSAMGAGKGIELTWTNVNQAHFNNDQNIFNYVVGSAANEEPNGLKYRKRDTLLGDVINSTVAVVSKFDFGYTQARSGLPGYIEYYRWKQNTRKPVVYVGSNNGFLHGFHGETGAELFAFMPLGAASQGNLPNLVNRDYGHKYFVDGHLHEHDVNFTGTANGWKTVLVGGLGAGGKSVFALDVTDGASGFSKSNILWEFTDADMGYSFGEPAVGRLKNGKWAAIFGNGYGTKADGTLLDSVLYVLDLQTGALISKVTLAANTGGLSSPGFLYTVPSRNNPIAVDKVFAGDRAGNLWQLNGANDGSFSSAFSSRKTPQPLFTAMVGTQRQPITTRPIMAVHPEEPGTHMVYFGTGSFSQLTDVNKDVQSVYGIWTQGTAGRKKNQAQPISARTSLQEIKITSETSSATMSDARLVEERDAIDWDTKAGWYMDLRTRGTLAEGERVLNTMEFISGTLFVNTFLPNEDPCLQSDNGWMMAFNPATGSRPKQPVFDYNGDGKVDQSDNFGANGEDIGSGIRDDRMLRIRGLMFVRMPVPGCDPSVQDCELEIRCNYNGIPVNCPNYRDKRLSWEQIDVE